MTLKGLIDSSGGTSGIPRAAPGETLLRHRNRTIVLFYSRTGRGGFRVTHATFASNALLDCAAMPAPQPPESAAVDRIGVFDSGLGGLSVLRALHRQLPQAPLHYLADSANAPYGDRSEAFIVERSQRIAQHLVARGATLLVVACNTATAAAVASLRERWPALPIVGVEPGLKPAAAATRTGRIGVLATTGTLRSAKFRQLLERQGGAVQIVAQPCPGLADLIEQGALDTPALRAMVERCCAPLREAGVDTVVLGCTHYPFVQHLIAAAMGPQVQIIDTADAVARRAAQLWRATAAAPAAADVVTLETTGDVEALRRVAASWLPFRCEVSAADA
jgi:glutamate racemase